jgi:HAD superfamily hydrolase (TIGR01509 family)
VGGEISTVLFDADGVLQFGGPLYAHFDEAHGWPRQKVDDFFRHVFHERDDYEMHPADEASVVAAFGAALADWGWTGTVDRFLRDWLTLGTVPDSGALELVSALRTSGVVCGLASNQEAIRARYMDEELGYRDLFDHRFYSAFVGYAKPDQDYFRAVLAMIDAEPDEVLFIDDRADNVEAARRCGLHARVHGPGDRLRDTLLAYGLPV